MPRPDMLLMPYAMPPRATPLSLDADAAIFSPPFADYVCPYAAALR